MGNRFLSDFKWNQKKKLKSLKGKISAMSAEWDDVDNFLSTEIESINVKIDEILEEIEQIKPEDLR